MRYKCKQSDGVLISPLRRQRPPGSVVHSLSLLIKWIGPTMSVRRNLPAPVISSRRMCLACISTALQCDE
jgi:hypothetical protein